MGRRYYFEVLALHNARLVGSGGPYATKKTAERELNRWWHKHGSVVFTVGITTSNPRDHEVPVRLRRE